jgi:hypothetical protein
MEKMSVLTVSPEYGALLTRFPPKVIRTEKENEAYTEILYDLDRRSKTLTRAEKELAELLTVLIEDFEEKRYQMRRTTPAGRIALPDGSARYRAEGPRGRVRNAKHRVGSSQWQAGIEQGPHQAIERPFPRLAGTFLLEASCNRNR